MGMCFSPAWNNAALQGVRDSHLGAPEVGRALAMSTLAFYDAWAPHDDRAVGTQLGSALRRPPLERSEANKNRALSYAAFRALLDVFKHALKLAAVPRSAAPLRFICILLYIRA